MKINKFDSFKKFYEGVTFRGYGGPAFDWTKFKDEYDRNEYHTYKQLYDDVQLELSNIAVDIQKEWGISYKELIWFESSVEPKLYTSGMTVESCWEEDYSHGTNNFQSLIEYLEERDGPFDPEDLQGIDPTKMESLKKMMWNFDYDNIKDDEIDLNWGPHDWMPDGEWGRCKRIKYDEQEFPVTVLVNGKMIDGAHRLAVAIFNRSYSYPCLVGIPEHWFDQDEEN